MGLQSVQNSVSGYAAGGPPASTQSALLALALLGGIAVVCGLFLWKTLRRPKGDR